MRVRTRTILTGRMIDSRSDAITMTIPADDTPKTADVEIYPELCCERCQSIIHTHFDCPSCGRDRAGTSLYHHPERGDEFTCNACDELFRLESEFHNYRGQTVTVSNLMTETECACGAVIRHKPQYWMIFCDDCETALDVRREE